MRLMHKESTSKTFADISAVRAMYGPARGVPGRVFGWKQPTPTCGARWDGMAQARACSCTLCIQLEHHDVQLQQTR
jgi:hypothetical protein